MLIWSRLWYVCALTATVSRPAAAGKRIDSYAPRHVRCPDRNLLRSCGTVEAGNQTVGPKERAYVQKRRAGPVAKAFKQCMARHRLGYDLSRLAPTDSDWPIVSLAASGGGFRASLVAAGTFDALDGRNTKAIKAGTGGILQLATYMSGLSGGSWFVSSLAINDLPSIRDLILGSEDTQGWFLDKPLALPAGGLHMVSNAHYYKNLLENIDLKRKAGFAVQYTDAWGIALAYKFGSGGTSEDNYYKVYKKKHNTPVQWGQIRHTAKFKDGEMPFPMIVANSRPPGFSAPVDKLETFFIPINSTVYEINPFEFGSWDAELAHFIELDYTGISLIAGKPASQDKCVRGFSNFGFSIGTSSSLFNAIIQTGNATLLVISKEKILQRFTKSISDDLGVDVTEEDDDVANYPNPFQGINPDTYAYSYSDEIDLVDGGEAGANIPLDPLLVKARKVDTIIAIDGSADTAAFCSNGMALRASYKRAQRQPEQQSLPKFPPSKEFTKKNGLAKRPVFFGCEASAKEQQEGMPLVVYLPNRRSKKSFITNTSTYKLEYSEDEQREFLESTFDITAEGFAPDNKSGKNEWSVCLACAIVNRRREAAGLQRSDKCERCFRRYCYANAE